MKYFLRLYITDQTVNSVRALENLDRICKDQLQGNYELEVVDILKNPRLAEEDKIIATPTLLKKLPPPACKIVGDLSDRKKVLQGLDIMHVESEAVS